MQSLQEKFGIQLGSCRMSGKCQQEINQLRKCKEQFYFTHIIPSSKLANSAPEIAAPFWGVISMESAPQTVTVLSNRVAFCLNSHRVLRAGEAQLGQLGIFLQSARLCKFWGEHKTGFSCKKAAGVVLTFSLSAHSPSGRHGKRNFVSPSDSYAEILTL